MLKFDKVPPICRVFFHGKVHFSHAGSSVKTLNVLQRLGGHFEYCCSWVFTEARILYCNVLNWITAFVMIRHLY